VANSTKKFPNVKISPNAVTLTAGHVGVGLRLECTASIGSVYWQSFQVSFPFRFVSDIKKFSNKFHLAN
jgi:hypothetical protein